MERYDMGILRYLLIGIFIIASSFSSGPYPPTMVCYYPLSLNGGFYAENLVNRTLSPIAVAPYTMTTRGNALYFAGPTTSKVTIGKPSTLNLTASTMTISCWCYFTNLSGGVNSGYRYICSDYNAAGNQAQFALQVNNASKLTFFWTNSGTQAPNPTTGQSGQTMQTGTWYFFAATRSGVSGSWTTELYINGSRDGGTSTATNPCAQASAGNAMIGQAGDYTGAALGMVGYIKDLRIYCKSLSATDIRQIYFDEYSKYNKTK